MSERLSAKRLRELLHYNAETGLFHWAVKRNGSKGIDSPAGSPNQKGHINIGIDGVRYRAHRLAWLYVYGRWPEKELDHINRVKADNRIANLREVSRSQNVQNTLLRANNKSGQKGVCWKKEKGVWGASIAVNGKQYHLGYYLSVEAASAAYKKAAARFHTHNPVSEGA